MFAEGHKSDNVALTSCPAITSYAALGKLLHFFEPQFSHQHIRDNIFFKALFIED